MYRPPAYVVDDVPTLHAIIRARSFATIATVATGEAALAYAPTFLRDGGLGTLEYHLARGNPLATIERARVRISFLGPDAYISPDWYGSDNFVPTWNYIAVEAGGVAERLRDDELLGLLEDLSAQHEARLLPKKPWTMDKLSASRRDQLLQMIIGFRVRLETLEGKFKLSQEKRPEQFAGVVEELEARADPVSASVAAAMRNYAGKPGR